MNQIDRLNKLFHRGICLNSKTNLPKNMENFLKLNSLDQTIMNIIFGNNNISINKLTKILNKSKSTMTSAINRLEEKQLIKREQSKKDKRVFILTLTNMGLELQNAHHMFENELFVQILSTLEDYDEKEFFLELLEKIINEFEKKYEGE